ncbi:MAG: zinc-ribbon domain-containing protein [Myxococcaceae bacterium]
MDVRCERCKTEYEFDDARITEAGVTVKCTTCSHVFKVKKKALVFTVPVKPDELAQGGPADPRPAAASPQREWKVRQASGNVFNFKELTTLQKWIVERKVSRDDEISLTGESWKRLGNIAELASFFQVVDEAQKGNQLAAIQSQAALGLGTPAFTPPGGFPVTAHPSEPSTAVLPNYTPPQAPAPAAPVYQAHPAPAPAPPAQAPRPRSDTEPSFARPPRVRVDLDDDEVAAAALGKKKGGAGRWLGVLFFLAVLGGGGYAGYTYYWLPLQQREAEERNQAEKERLEKANADAEAAKLKAEADAKAAAEAKKAADEKAAKDAALAAAALDAGAPDAGSTAKAEAKHDFNYYMAQGDRLREREKAEAALDAYGKAADLKPERAEPVAGRGLSLLDMGQPLPAQVSFEQALKLNSRYGVALMGLAESLKAQGKKEQAIKAYQRYLDELPNGGEANVARGAIERLKQ